MTTVRCLGIEGERTPLVIGDSVSLQRVERLVVEAGHLPRCHRAWHVSGRSRSNPEHCIWRVLGRKPRRFGVDGEESSTADAIGHLLATTPP